MPDVECEVCGGTDFYKESGHYYCKECQTQTQEILEHVFEEELVNVKSTKKIKKLKEKTDNKITSWECYNIILCSLTKQLINLGAGRKLKPIVKCLWMLYLEKLEVIKPGDEMPKLPVIKYRKDAEIIYGIKMARKRRRSNSSKSDSDNTLNTSASVRRERGRKKRALAESHLEELSQKSHQDSLSLHNETLTSIKSSSDRSSLPGSRIYNKYAVKELRKKIGKIHIKKHLFNQNVDCHKVTHKSCSYKHKATLISPIKLYCLLYLGLLINKDSIQLGDLLRFINEGHISFNFYTHLFPEEYHNKLLNFNNHLSNQIYSNLGFRKQTASLVNFLGLHSFLKIPDLPKLCKRVCKELNLPESICNCAIRLIIKSTPKMQFVKKQNIMPNYEGRVVSIILVVLKLLFGLDDMTEYEFSRYAKLCNQYLKLPNMFDVINWMKYLEYRNLLINEYHFPTQYNNDQTAVDSDLYLQYISTKSQQYVEDLPLPKYTSEYKQILMKLKDIQENFIIPMEFPHSLTPFLDYCQVLMKTFVFQKKTYMHNILRFNFTESSIDFLLKPNKFLELINKSKEIEIKNGGANDNWTFSEIQTPHVQNRERKKQERKLVTVKMDNCKKEYLKPDLPNNTTKEIDSKHILNEFQEGRANAFLENKKQTDKYQMIELNLAENVNMKETYSKHFNPYERYWMYYRRYTDLMSRCHFEVFLKEYPQSFQLIFNETARVVEQTTQELYLEFQLTEAYLVYVAKYKPKDTLQKADGIKLRNIVTRAKKNW